MFQEIRIRGVGVIDDAVLPLSPGLNVVTGETGAGKTMVVSGLGLLLGARGEAGLVRTGATAARIEGLLDLPPGHPALDRAAEAGADRSETDGVDAAVEPLVLVRTVSKEGRSRAHVGGTSTPVGVLAELGELLVAVHGQADQWRLRQGDQHREVLDTFGGAAVGAPLAAYRETYDRYLEARAERDRLRGLARDRAREVELLRSGLDRIAEVDPTPGEDAELRAEEGRLAHADGLRAAVEAAHAALSGDEGYAGDGSSGAGATGVVEATAAARASLASVAEHDPAVVELERRMAELGYLAADLAADLASYVSGIDVDPARLAAVQERRAVLSGLTRMFGDTVDDVLLWAKESAVALTELLEADDRVDALDQEADRLRATLAEQAADLTAARVTAAQAFGDRVTQELQHLAMPRASVSVEVGSRPDPAGLRVGDETVRTTRHGVDDVEIQLRAGPGEPPRNVAKAASGGELSRVMLAIEVVSSGAGHAHTGGAGDSATGGVRTFVFDEVDAGVGGSAALDVGARLSRLAAHAQVVVVTHLAQVAAFADQHLVVRKDVTEGAAVTSSDVRVLSVGERAAELSRMMGGDPDSAAGLEHARQLLAQAAARRARDTRDRSGIDPTAG